MCEELNTFADGELPDDRADAFRDHLRSCEACREKLVEAVQLSARLSGLGELLASRRACDR